VEDVEAVDVLDPLDLRATISEMAAIRKRYEDDLSPVPSPPRGGV
jgi:hypothetical protein